MKGFFTYAGVALLTLSGSAILNAQSGSGPTDPQIAGIVVAANQIDIDAGKLALKKTKNAQVRQLAQQMVDDHTKLQGDVGALAKKLNVTPAPSPTQQQLKSQADQTMAKLKGLSGAAFDKAYVDNEVTYHQAVIDATKSTLIPNAQNADLKSALESAAPLFEGHLQHAQQVQSSLGGK